ncbi:MAG: S8 family serine peptidase [Acidobacteriota bacterium]
MSVRVRAAVAVLSLIVCAGLFADETTSQPKLAPSALEQMRVIQELKISKNPAQSKLDSRLYFGVLHQELDPRLTLLKDFRFVKDESDGRFAVDVLLVSRTALKPVLEKIEQLGGVVLASSARFQRIAARMPLSGVEELAAMPEVRRVRQAIPHLGHKINTSEGDLTHLAQLSRGIYGAYGSGMKVCVISDGIDSLVALQASGDLPAVDVLPGQAGTGDEGSAMLEIVHDLAPAATLGFASALPDEATFAQNILDLAADGCNVIVDDIVYLDESPFQDGPVAQSVNTVTAGGVLYFSSAGNEGNANDLTSGTWEGDFNANGTVPVLAGSGPSHNFGDGGQSILVEFGGGNPPLLTWAEHYDLATGTASTDFDLYDLDGGLTTIFDASTDAQDGVGGDDFPIEFIGGGTFGGERLVVAKFADGTTSSTPMFNLIVFRGELDDALATSGATRGHSAAADAFSIAATPAADSFDGITPDGPYPGAFTSANESESFTSDGPRRILLSPTGVEITPGNRTSTGGIVRQKPDLTAADGVATAAPGFNPFYGTSAAAPHAAAIAAMLKGALPGLTPAQVRTALVSSAIDIENPGVDRDTGAGIVMANLTLAAAGATAQAFLDDGAPVPAQVLGDGDAFVEPNEVWNVTLPLTNIGAANATAISAVLSTVTPGVTILSANAAYADLAPAATGNNLTPYVFRVDSSFVCGTIIDFTWTVTYAGGASPQSFSSTMKVGAPGAPVTVSYTGPPVAIADSPDNSGTSAGPLAVANLLVAGVPGSVFDVDLRFDGDTCSNVAGATTVGLDHTFVSDLKITLRSPATTPVMVMNQFDGSGNNLCQTLLDDESAGASIQSAVSGNAPFTGSWLPNLPLSAFDGQTVNGTWQLEAQDFFVGDVGSIRAFSLIITPVVCDAPPLTAIVNGTKAVSGTFRTGGTVTYTVTLTNAGGLAQGDNPGPEFSDVLPASLTLVTASSTSGTSAASVGTNTVTWDGTLAPVGGSVTITITATVNGAPGAVVSNQGNVNSDANADGTNETAGVTDDPGVGGATDPTSFTVGGSIVTATKTVSGTFLVGSTVTYTITLSNSGPDAAPDNAGNEFTDVLPSSLTLVSANATSGSAVATVGTNTVTWNGAVPAAGSVTITITATINAGTAGQSISNQGTASFDANTDGTNESSAVTDDPGTAGAANATAFAVVGPSLTATKSVSGSFVVGSDVTYTITISNSGASAAPDNAGNELTDILPATLDLLTANASSGTAVANQGTNTVTWNGAVPAGGSVTIIITATILPAAGGQSVSNQASVIYDADLSGSNETTIVTNDPSTVAAGDATTFAAVAPAEPIPTLTTWALLLMALAIAVVAIRSRLA